MFSSAENDSNMPRVRLFFFEKGENSLRFQNCPDTCELSIQLDTVTDHNGSGAYQNS